MNKPDRIFQSESLGACTSEVLSERQFYGQLYLKNPALNNVNNRAFTM